MLKDALPLVSNRFSFVTKKTEPVPTTQSTSNTSQDLFSKTLGELEKKKEETQQPLVGRPKVLTKRGVRIRAPDEAWAKVTSVKGSIKKVKLVAGIARKYSIANKKD